MANVETVMVAITTTNDKLVLMEFVTKQYASVEGPGWTREASVEQINAEITHANIPASHWRRIDKSEIPQDRTFRNAWYDNDGTIAHNMNVAREIHMTRLRKERANRLEQLDIEWMRAFGQGRTDDAAQIEAQRQTLRDFPKTIEAQLQAASTPEELKRLTLETNA